VKVLVVLVVLVVNTQYYHRYNRHHPIEPRRPVGDRLVVTLITVLVVLQMCLCRRLGNSNPQMSIVQHILSLVPKVLVMLFVRGGAPCGRRANVINMNIIVQVV